MAKQMRGAGRCHPIESKDPSRSDSKSTERQNLVSLAVDETFTHVFKEAGAQAIYSFLEESCQLSREKIPERPKAFSASLRKLLGSAAPVIESLIVKNLCQKSGVEFEKKAGYKLGDYIMELRR